MAQEDYILANQAGNAFRSDLNDTLAAIVSNNSGATEPATMYAYMWWADTTSGLLKQRNAANNAWINKGTLATAISANTGLINLQSAVATTSGTSIAITGIPAGVKRFSVDLSKVSVNGSDKFAIQLGDSGGIESSGYSGGAGNKAGEVDSTSRFILNLSTGLGSVFSGIQFFHLADESTNTWVFSGGMNRIPGGALNVATGSKSLSGELTQILLTTDGTDAYDAGSATIAWEF